MSPSSHVRVRRGKIFFKHQEQNLLTTTETAIRSLGKQIHQKIVSTAVGNSSDEMFGNKDKVFIPGETVDNSVMNVTTMATTTTETSHFNNKVLKTVLSKDRQSAIEWVVQSKGDYFNQLSGREQSSPKIDPFDNKLDQESDEFTIWEAILLITTVLITAYIVTRCLKCLTKRHIERIERMRDPNRISPSESVIHKAWCFS
jgi:hypothetical protein